MTNYPDTDEEITLRDLDQFYETPEDEQNIFHGHESSHGDLYSERHRNTLFPNGEVAELSTAFQKMLHAEGLKTVEDFCKNLQKRSASRLEEDPSLHIEKFDIEIAKRWIAEGEFHATDARIMPLIANFFDIGVSTRSGNALFRVFSVSNSKSVRAEREAKEQRRTAQRIESETQQQLTADFQGSAQGTHEFTKAQRALSSAAQKEKTFLFADEPGYFALYLQELIKVSGLSREEIAFRMHVPNGYIEACETGEIVPLGQPLNSLVKMFKADHDPEATQTIENLIHRDLRRLRDKYAIKSNGAASFEAIKKIGALTMSIHFHEFMDTVAQEGRFVRQATLFQRDDIDKIVDATGKLSPRRTSTMHYISKKAAEEGRFAEFYNRGEHAKKSQIYASSLTQCICDEANETIETLLYNFITRRPSRRSASELLNEYILHDSPNILGYLKYVSEFWNESIAQTARMLNLKDTDRNNLNYDMSQKSEFGHNILEQMMVSKNGFSRDDCMNLYAMRYGNLDTSQEQIIQDAQDILNTENPQPEDFSENLVFQRMIKGGPNLFGGVKQGPYENSIVDGHINKHRVPHAMLSVLLDRIAIPSSRFIDSTTPGLYRNWSSPHDVRMGKIDFVVKYKADGSTGQIYVQHCKPIAKFFSDKPKVRQAIGMALIEHGTKFTPLELFEEVKSQNISAQQMIRTLRLQRFMNGTDVGKKIEPDAKKKSAMTSKIETKGLSNQGGAAAKTRDIARKYLEFYNSSFPESQRMPVDQVIEMLSGVYEYPPEALALNEFDNSADLAPN